MMRSQDEEERIQAMAASMAIQLHALFPDGYSPEDPDQCQRIQECFHNLVDPEGHNFHPNHGPIHNVHHLKMAIPIAVQQWKKLQANPNKTTKPQSKSFSLLDQWMSEGFSEPVFYVGEILELPNVAAQLQRLQESKYLEDVLADWNAIKQVLWTGLEYVPSGDITSTTISTRDPEEGSSRSIAMESLQLHRKWFDEARSSREYLKVQYDLLSNVTKSLLHNQGPSKHQEQWRWDRLRNWHDMLVDLMERGEYLAEEMKEMEVFFFHCLGSGSMNSDLVSSADNNTTTIGTRRSLSNLEMLALLDPSAHGFGAWIHHVPLSSLQSLLEQSPQVLSTIWNCACGPNSSDSTSGRADHLDDNKIRTVRQWYCLSVLRYLLNKLRVVLFPWQQLLWTVTPGTPHGETSIMATTEISTTMTIAELQYQVLDCFVEGAIQTSKNDESDDDNNDDVGHVTCWRRDLCFSAMETMIWGLGTEELVQVKQRLSWVEHRSSFVWTFLQNLLSQVERHR